MFIAAMSRSIERTNSINAFPPTPARTSLASVRADIGIALLDLVAVPRQIAIHGAPLQSLDLLDRKQQPPGKPDRPQPPTGIITGDGHAGQIETVRELTAG
jgi:hypothetical protein